MEQTTDTTIETTDVVDEVVEQVQADSLDDLLDNVADGLLEEDQPVEEVEEEPEPEKEPEEEKPEKHKVKVDGEELEIDYTELVKGYQTSKHNTQTAQQLADSQRQLAPVIGLAKRLEEDKDFAAYVFGYGKEPEKELDPIEQIKADAVKAALAKVDEKFKGQTEQARQAEITTLREKVQADPLYSQVQDKLAAYVGSLPKKLQRQMYDTLDTDPEAYIEMYQRARATIEPKKEEPAKKIVPPVLVDAGQTSDVPLRTLKKQKLDKKRAEVLKSGNAEALEEYFMMDGGLIDSLGL